MYIEDEEENDRADRNHEPEALRNLTKKQMHKMMSFNLILPCPKSRACSRRLYCGLFTEEYFGVNKVQLLEFEARLQPEDLVRSPDQSLSSIIQKINFMLAQAGHNEIGIELNALCDEDFAYRVLRWVDPCNTMRSFRRAVPGAPRPVGFLARL